MGTKTWSAVDKDNRKRPWWEPDYDFWNPTQPWWELKRRHEVRARLWRHLWQTVKTALTVPVPVAGHLRLFADVEMHVILAGAWVAEVRSGQEPRSDAWQESPTSTALPAQTTDGSTMATKDDLARIIGYKEIQLSEAKQKAAAREAKINVLTATLDLLLGLPNSGVEYDLDPEAIKRALEEQARERAKRKNGSAPSDVGATTLAATSLLGIPITLTAEDLRDKNIN